MVLSGDGEEFYYIQTMFYSSKSITSNRAQTAYAYRKNRIAYRYYYNGIWSEWVIYEETEWQEVSNFLNGWVNYGESFSTAGYKKNGKLVYLKGLIKSGTIGANAFRLATEYRPTATRIFSGIANSGTLAEIRVEKSGYVTITRGTTAWVSLDGISYYLD